ncbi:MAG: hypothetical protein ACK5O7_00645 [Holosporales bacterium]
MDQKERRQFFSRIMCLLVMAVGQTELCPASQLSASEGGDAEVYARALTTYTKGHFQEALVQFQPLVEKNHTEAIYHTALSLEQVGHGYEAYEKLQQLAEQGHGNARTHLEQMNLFFGLLPDEMVLNILHHGGLEALSNLKGMSHRLHGMVHELLRTTNFATSPSVFAEEWRQSVLGPLRVNGKPDTIHLMDMISVDVVSTSGSSEPRLELHFRDPDHLKSLAKKLNVIEGPYALIYVHDPNVQDGEELVAHDAVLQKQPGVLIRSARHVQLLGTPQRKYTFVLDYPGGSVFITQKSIPMKARQKFAAASLLAEMMETTHAEKISLKTEEARLLLGNPGVGRAPLSQTISQMEQLFPEANFVSPGGSLTAQQVHVLTLREPDDKALMVYFAPTYGAAKALRDQFPTRGRTILCVTQMASGLEWRGHLQRSLAYELNCSDQLQVFGNISLPDDCITLEAKQLILVNFSITAKNFSLTWQQSCSFVNLITVGAAPPAPGPVYLVDQMRDLIKSHGVELD